MAETSTIFGFMKYVSATDILSDFKKTVDSHFVNSLKGRSNLPFFMPCSKIQTQNKVNYVIETYVSYMQNMQKFVI